MDEKKIQKILDSIYMLVEEDCDVSLDGKVFRYLVCYEGEYVGIDPDDGWSLFKPKRIVWTHDTGSKIKREKYI